jgi:hypothetical protein
VLLEVGDDGPHRLPQRVDVEAVEPDLLGEATPRVAIPQPGDEPGDLVVRPHPGRPALERREDLLDAAVVAVEPPDPGVHLEAGRPVALDHDHGEPALLDQAAGDLGAPPVVLVGTVGGLPEEDVACVADAREQGVQVGGAL